MHYISLDPYGFKGAALYKMNSLFIAFINEEALLYFVSGGSPFIFYSLITGPLETSVAFIFF